MRRLVLALAGGLMAACLAGAVTGCARPALEPPAQAVQELLELRSANSTDAALYARYVETTTVADALAQDAATRREASPVPKWKIAAVEISEETSASVRVEWIPAQEFEGWPKATTFLLREVDGRWVVVDATEASEPATTTVEP